MKFEVVTSMNKSYYNTIGKTMLESFIDKWPSEIPLRVYTEEDKNTFDLPEHKRYTLHRLYDTQPELQEFIERNKNRPDQQNPKELHKGAIRFSYKTYSIIDACTNTDADFIIWLDADTYTHSFIKQEFLESLTKPHTYTSYLGRENNYSECGFVIYNINHKDNLTFMNTWGKFYRSDTIFLLPQWHDSFVFDTVRRMFEKDTNMKNYNMSPWGKDYDHVFINSCLGEYMDHMKGNRKYEGKSRISDITRNLEATYWRDL